MDTITKANRVIELVGIINDAERELRVLLPPDASEEEEPQKALAFIREGEKETGDEPRKVPSTGGPVIVPLACCGSMGTKHRRDCPVRHPDAAARAPVRDDCAPWEWRCSDCRHSFDSGASKLDVTCPKCGGIHVVKREVACEG